MYRIRRVHDADLPGSSRLLDEVKEVLHSRFSALGAEELAEVDAHLRNPFKRRFRTLLLVAEDERQRVLGCALVLHEPDLAFSYLEFLAAARSAAGRGVGASLYERVREEAAARGDRGLFFECLPDDPALCPDAALLAENRARLRFYERFGARPIAGTAYETPVKPGGTCPPYLVFDGLDAHAAPRLGFSRRVVRAILTRKYRDVCPPDYVRRVLASFGADPVAIRPPRYGGGRAAARLKPPAPRVRIPLVVNDRHEIHHVRERGYVEAPVRVASLLAALEPSGLFARLEPVSFPQRSLTAIHAPELVSYLRRASLEAPAGKSVYPYVFPIRNASRLPRERSVLAGYFCIDTFTPIHRNAYPAARRAVDCALTAARQVRAGCGLAYALVRPPGHHAESRVFGGFCYFNNAAAAAQLLAAEGKVAILDVDYHHGNGQQEIFYRRADVLTVSIHAHPRFAYPYFTGFPDENGEGAGEGSNLNIALPESCDGAAYRRALRRALKAIAAFAPRYLVVALGLDPARADPTGTWSLVAADFRANGAAIAELGLPTVVVQEGGYRTRTLGANALAFFAGLLAGGLRP